MEFDKTIGGHAHEIVTRTVHKTLPRSPFLCITGPCAVLFSRISSRFTGDIGYFLLCMPPFAFWCQCCQLSSILGLSEDIVKSGFDHSIVRLPILSSPIYLFTKNFSVFFLDKELEKVLDIEVTSDTKQRIFCFSFSYHLTRKLRAGKVFSRVCLSIQGWGSPPCRPPSLAPPLGTPLVCNSIHGGFSE